MKKNVSKKHLRVLSIMLSAFLYATGLMAQSVTVSPRTGSMIPSMTQYGGQTTELGWGAGAFATWVHKQLPLTITVGDRPSLTQDGLLEIHANNLYPNSAAHLNDDPETGPYLVMVAGQTSPGYMTFALPKGYRFTSYRIVLVNNVEKVYNGNNAISNLGITTSRNITFGETNSNWNRTNVQDTYVNMGTTSSTNTKEYVVQRTNSNDMGNILYFTLLNEGEATFRSVAFKYIMLEFSPEAPFTTSIAPTTDNNTAVSYVQIPFKTGKQDLGSIEQRTYQNATRNGYFYSNVKDAPADMYLYQENAIPSTKEFPTANVDDKTITSTNGYYKLAGGTDGHVYYVETPEHTEFGGFVHYRITGATINYAPFAPSYFYITDGNGNYLGTNLRFGTAKTEWNINSDGKIYSGNTYLREDGTSLTTTNRINRASTFTIDNDGHIYYTDSEWQQTGSYFWQGEWVDVIYYLTSSAAFSTSTSNLAQTAKDVDEEGTLRVYDKTGTTFEEILVTREGSYTLEGLNNDAIKFEVIGTALINVDLTTEALNPYISNIDVQLSSTPYSVTRGFPAGDFAIGGGSVDFTVPVELIGRTVTTKFTNLRSNYADATYGDFGSEEHNSRYNFVKSDYFNLHNDGPTEGDAAISFVGENSIYADSYDPDHTYTDKIEVSVAGNTAFKFNNADTYEQDIANSTSNPKSTTLKENEFRLAYYADQVDLYGAEKNGSFQATTFVPAEGETVSQDAYIFVADETRYNIAPTYAVQHRSHAFYNVTVNVKVAEYDTSAELTKIYDDTFYGTGENGAFYGATVTSVLQEGDDETQGIVSVAHAIEVIKEAAEKEGVDLAKILYLDLGSELSGIYTKEENEWASIKENFTAPNLLTFLPKNTNHPESNYAYALEGSTELAFQAAGDIIITDKQPFYTPYDIMLNETNAAKYDRQVTNPKNGQVEWATIIMPFALKGVTEGIWEGADGTKVALLKMNETDALESTDEVEAVAEGYFGLIIDEQTVANAPYLLHVEKNASEDENVSFSLQQKGAYIVKTPSKEASINAEETSTAGDITLTMAGTYAGEEIDKEERPIFYFSKNGFYNSTDLKEDIQTAKVLPFRSYYNFTATEAPIKMFSMVIGTNPNGSETRINNMKLVNSGVFAGKGTITIAASKDAQYNIDNISGFNVNSLKMNEGETRTVSVPAGIYIVNGVKVIVK